MDALTYANGIETTLAVAALAADTQLQLPQDAVYTAIQAAMADSLPSGNIIYRSMLFTLGDPEGAYEIVRGVSAGGAGVVNVLRAQEGTAAVQWPIDTPVRALLTAEGMRSLRSGWCRSKVYEVDLSAGDVTLTLSDAHAIHDVRVSPWIGGDPLPGSTLTIEPPTLGVSDNRDYFEGRILFSNESAQDVSLAWSVIIPIGALPGTLFASTDLGNLFRLTCRRASTWYVDMIQQ